MLSKLGVLTIAALIFLVPIDASFATTRVLPSPYVTSAPGGGYYIKMVPGPREGEGNGYVYSVGAEADTLIYKTSGWFAWEVFLSPYGETLCRVNYDGRIGGAELNGTGMLSEPFDAFGPNPQIQVALEFYKKGELMRSYTVSDLVSNREKLQLFGDFYTFFADKVRFYQERLSAAQMQSVGATRPGSFWIVARTVDNQTHVFDLETGERVAGEDLAKALDMTQRDAKQIAAEYLQKQGLQLKEPVHFLFPEGLQYVILCDYGTKPFRVIVERRTGAAITKEGKE